MCLLPLCVMSQTKNEQEMRIDKQDFPSKALELLELFPEHSKNIKYYFETDGDNTSYEAKLILNKRVYSIEFNEDGTLQDVEIRIKKRKIKHEALDQINNWLNKNYRKHYLLKIQKQYKPSKEQPADSTIINAINFKYESQTNFEIIVETQDFEKNKSLIELTLSPKGEVIQIRALEPSSYEHVLY
jgi:sporulation protein YlmC with PRC-barrel domain